MAVQKSGGQKKKPSCRVFDSGRGEGVDDGRGRLAKKCNPLSLSYSYSKYGKPYLKGKENIYFNVSHSRDYVVCAFSDNEVGIDIQVHKKWKKELAQRFFSEEDKKLLARLENEGFAPSEMFFCMWTVKESYMKLTGGRDAAGAGCNNH